MAQHNYYSILGVDATAGSDEVRKAYHRALLQSHPDKAVVNGTADVDADLLKTAYKTLSSVELRAEHDERLARRQAHASSTFRDHAHAGSRAAETVSLEDFNLVAGSAEWTYPCRCGMAYRISEGQLERDIHLVSCEGCSEVLWVGYEAEME